nr:hypothetical protein StreXyl84_15900 [Streptomyces sp. Xyl84]
MSGLGRFPARSPVCSAPVPRPSPNPGGPMPPTAELIGAAVTLLGLGFLTVCSVRSITRRGPSEVE